MAGRRSRRSPAALLAKSPLDFKQMAMAMHGGFDNLASAADHGEPAKTLAGRLAGLLDRCAACHQAFRFDVTP